ncbi:MerR family transcriptional regulator [Mycetocola reblochoni]|uniref:Transcriptional regulator, MerR family n=2 Tax=Mycetocola reblochoni TaxID=331618 RepID=A0A1R4ISA0_9MICO|nr:MerR family transcriptional regulator [Mycetocola reblochoni]RLP71128.1 MerR family transcriptional regulator [Mycetocola reblochoni]SJN22455.1 Transcriptional regulator, MerR family [Mycetocola reblochoni REB411]
MRIGEAARRVGVDAHVLRHWHDTGVVVADRSAAGHRLYTDEHIVRLTTVLACQEVGLSLPEIRTVLHRGETGRRETINRRLARIRAQRARLDEAESFLQHVVDCTHDLLTRCPDCTRYAGTAPEQTMPFPRR